MTSHDPVALVAIAAGLFFAFLAVLFVRWPRD